MELKKAIKIVNNIADFAVYSYVPNSEDTEFVRQGKPTYFVGDNGRQAIKTVLRALKDKDKVIIEMEKILNQWMPLAECLYWNYENHTCSHTCSSCDNLNKNNRRTDSGVLIDDDRYCRLYEDGYAEENTVFVKIEDLILRHGTKSITRIIGR